MEIGQDNSARPTWLTRLGLGTIRQDLLSSLVVFLVALPLCMGIALASGAPVASGLVTGIIGGLIVGFISGAPLQVSGPAAGLTIVVGEVIREHGLPAMGVVVMIAGALQLTAGICKLGQWFRAVSPAVIHGMLSGIGVLILSSQIHVMVDDRPRESGVANITSIPEALWKGLPLPQWETPELRQARIDFLQGFGQLHERQKEIDDHVARLVSSHGTERQHAQEAERLAAFIPLQDKLTGDVRAMAERVQASPLAAANGERADRLQSTLAKARLSLAAALDDLKAHDVASVEDSQARASASLAGVLANLKSHDWAAKVGLLTIALIILWQAFAPRGIKLIPGPLVAIFTATLVAWLCALPVLYVEVPDNLIQGLTFPSLNVFQDVALRDLAIGGLMMAIIASAETLLCASAVDRMHTGPRTHYDQELRAQGIGNMLCGAFGALPMTGVIVRSAANVQAGAKSRFSSILHGLWLLTFVVALGSLLRLIPTAALAGILVYTGFKLIDFKGFWNLWKYSKSEGAIFLVTLVVIVVEDLLVGVVTGIVLSAVKLLVTFSRLDIDLVRTGGNAVHEPVTLRFAGAATFLRLPSLAAKLDEVPAGAQLHVDFEKLEYIDHACLELLMGWAKQHEKTGGELVIDWGQLHARFRGGKNGHTPAGQNGTDASDSERATHSSAA